MRHRETEVILETAQEILSESHPNDGAAAAVDLFPVKSW
jgi:hypothetical protein